MEQNDILSNKLRKKMNKIERMEAEIKEEKDSVLKEIKKEVPQKTFIEMTDKIIKYAYTEEKKAAKEIKEKEENSKLEYDDYVAVLKMYDNIAPNITKKANIE